MYEWSCTLEEKKKKITIEQNANKRARGSGGMGICKILGFESFNNRFKRALLYI